MPEIAQQVELATRGDEAALVELLRHLAPEIRADIAGRFPERHRGVASAEDVLQITMTDAFLAVRGKSFLRENDFLAWLKRIARNNLNDLIRMLDGPMRGGDLVRLAVDPVADSQTFVQGLFATESESPSLAMRAAEVHAALHAALAKLPTDYNCIVQARYFEQKSIREIAAFLGRSEGAVQMMLARALSVLRQSLREFSSKSSRPA